MTLKDISYWGLVKISLFISFSILIIPLPVLILIAHAFGKPIKWSFEADEVQILGTFSLKIDGPETISIPVAIIICVINYLVIIKVLHWIAQKTPLGRINIGNQIAK